MTGFSIKQGVTFELCCVVQTVNGTSADLTVTPIKSQIRDSLGGLIAVLTCAPANVFQAMRSAFLPQIQARYAYLRQAGVLSSGTMAALIRRYATFRVMDLEQDWALYGTNGIAIYRYIQDWYERRLAWLDAQWGYSA